MPETATAPPPVTAAAPPPETERAPADFMADAMSDFADMDAGKPPAEKPAEKEVAAPKAPKKPKEPEVEKPAVTEPEKPAETEKPAEVKPVKAAELRTAYENLKKRVKEEYEPQLNTLKARVKEFESKAPEDIKPMQDRVAALEKRNQELEKHIEFVDYSQSKTFADEYATPYKEAWADAVAEFRELTVREQEGEDEFGEAKFRERPADENDLLRLANMRLSDMDSEATRIFGPSAPRAVGHIQNLKKLSAKQAKALEEAKVKADEWRTNRQKEIDGRIQLRAKAWQDINKGLEEKFPKAFNVEEGNAEDAAAHAKGFALADLMFSGPGSLTPQQIETLPKSLQDTVKEKKPLSDIQQVQLHALGHLKMANHDRLLARLKQRDARISELEKSLSEYEGSSPAATKAGESGKTSSKDWLQTAEDELKAMDRG